MPELKISQVGPFGGSGRRRSAWPHRPLWCPLPGIDGELAVEPARNRLIIRGRTGKAPTPTGAVAKPLPQLH